MNFVTRDAVIVRFKQPVIDWLNSLPEVKPGEELSLEDINGTPYVFLIRECEDHKQAQRRIREMKPVLFEYLLNELITDPSIWPDSRSAKDFDRWFEIEYTDCIIDAHNGPIEKEDF